MWLATFVAAQKHTPDDRALHLAMVWECAGSWNQTQLNELYFRLWHHEDILALHPGLNFFCDGLLHQALLFEPYT